MATISIPGVKREQFTITIEGIKPLISNAIPRRVIEGIAAKSRGEPIPNPLPSDPEREFLESIYRTFDDEPGLITHAFKQCCISTARYIKEAKIVTTKGAFQIVNADPVALIRGSKPRPVELVVHPRGRGIVLVNCAQYDEWELDLEILHDRGVISQASIVNMFEVGGIHVGVGVRRPETGHSNGMFRVKRRAT